MKKFIYPVLLSIISVFLFAPQSNAFDLNVGGGYICVNGSGAANLGVDFQAALDFVDVNPPEDVRLVNGTFAIPATIPATIPADVHFNIETDHSLTISGGWNGDCSVQTADPLLTSLEGGTLQPAAVDPNNPAYNPFYNGFYGGGVFFVLILDNIAPATVSISNLSIRNGSSESDGGGLSIHHDFLVETAALATVTITDVIAEFNTTEVWYGSGIAVEDWGTDGGINISITDSIVRNNDVPIGSSAGPAGIFINNYGVGVGEVVITGSQILNNKAEFDGGGLFINSGVNNLTLVNNIIAGNYVADDYGGGIYISNVDGGNATLTNNTITANESAGLGGGGINVEMTDPASVLNIYNNIIYGNVASGVIEGADLDIYNPGVTVNLFNNDFDNTPTTGFYIEDVTSFSSGNNLDNVDPLFADALNDNYHLDAASPVIDMGDNAAPARPANDLDGNCRQAGPFVDMGAYEYGIRSVPNDFNGDCTSDILLRNIVSGAWHMNLMDGPNVDPYTNILLPLSFDMQLSGIADFNGDGNSDVLLRNMVNGNWNMYLMDGAIVDAYPRISLPKSFDMELAGIADFNGDGNSDVLLRNMVNGNWNMYLMDGAIVDAYPRISLPKSFNVELMGMADFDGDGNSDVLIRNMLNGFWHMYVMDGSTVNAYPKISLPLSFNVELAGLADFNGDGNSDILLRNMLNGYWHMYLMDGATVDAYPRISLPISFNIELAGIDDFDGNRNSDILLRNMLNGYWYMYLMDGATADPHTKIALPISSNLELAGMADFDGDSNSDILLRNMVNGYWHMYLMDGATVDPYTKIVLPIDLNLR